MSRILRLLCISLTIFLSPPALADFEADLSDTGNGQSIQPLRDLRAQAKAGDANAQLNMGGAYFKGEAVTQDYAEAAKWFFMAAQQGLAQAQFNLGMMYATGQGVAQNDAESVQWYHAAAVQGLAVAQLNLGVAYLTGQGIAQNEGESLKWISLAAKQGDAQAQFNLGVMYANGQGVPQNLISAFRWAKLSASQGHEIAPTLLQDLSERMTPEQLKQANNVARSEPKTKLLTQTPQATPTPDAQEKSEDSDIFLQLGAFKSEEDAKRFIAKINDKLGNIGKPLSLHTAKGLVRVHIGPYAKLQDARKVADSLTAKLGFKPLIKQH